MQFKLNFNIDGAAFEFEALEEITRIMKEATRRIETHGLSALDDAIGGVIIRDINGNTIGKMEIG